MKFEGKNAAVGNRLNREDWRDERDVWRRFETSKNACKRRENAS